MADQQVAIQIGAKVDEALKGFKQVSDATQQMANHVTSHINSIGSTFNSLTGIIGTMTTVLAGGAAFNSMISATTKWTGEVVQLSKTLGLTTQQASTMNVALRTLGIDTDTVKTATQRLAMSINKDGGDAIERLGVKTKDSSGNLRNASDIMLDVNEKLSGMKAGMDRNTAAAGIYGKGWLGIADILKLTRQEMEEAKAKAEQLHLVVGSDGADAVKKYKRNLNDLELTSTALKVALGKELIPVINDVGKAFSGAAITGAGGFASLVHDMIVNIATLKAEGGAAFRKVMAYPGMFGDQGEYRAEVATIDAMLGYNLQKISERYGGITTSVVKANTGGVSGTVNENLKGTADAAKEAASKFASYEQSIIGVAHAIRDLNPYLTEEQKENIKIDDTITSLMGKLPDHIEQIKVLGRALHVASDEAREYKQRMKDISIAEAEAEAAVSSFKFAGTATNMKYGGLQVKPGMMTGSGLYEDDAKSRLEIEKRYGAQIMDAKMTFANQGLELIKKTSKEGSAVYITALVAQKALSVAQILMSTHTAAAAALMPPPVGLGPVAGQALAAEITAWGYANAAMTGAIGIAELAGSLSGKALGGRVEGGTSYLVGEQGPEIITMGGDGYVTPNNRLGGGGVEITNVYQISTGVADTVRAEIARLTPQLTALSVQAVQQAINSGTGLSRAVGRM